MARIEFPPVPCPWCGEPRKVTTLRTTPMPGELVVDIRVEACTTWCALLRNAS